MFAASNESLLDRCLTRFIFQVMSSWIMAERSVSKIPPALCKGGVTLFALVKS